MTSLDRMHRAQLFELVDLDWTPAELRDSLVEALSRALRWGALLRGVIGPFTDFLARSGATEVLDLGSGAGGPPQVLVSELRRAGAIPPRFVLTDLFPRLEVWRRIEAAHGGDIIFHPEPVDATCIPAELSRGRARVMTNTFHHFRPDVARAVLADAVEGSPGIFIAELFERNPLRFLSVAPTAFAAAYANPVLSPQGRFRKALITWLVPVTIFAGAWDGIVSSLRVYSERELRAMVAPLSDRFDWVYGTYRFRPFGKGYYFYGVRK